MDDPFDAGPPVPTGSATFRPFGPDDYDALAAIRGAAYPDSPPSAVAMRHEDSLWDASRHWRSRMIAHDRDGRPVAYGDVAHMAWQFHPDRYATAAYVLPPCRGTGLGRSIAAWAERVARERRGTSIRAEVKADDTRSLEFAMRRGYVDRQRNWESRLDVAAFDGATLAAHVDRVASGGIEVVTLADLLEGASDARRRAILVEYHALDAAATKDEPSLDPITPPPFETWRGYVLEGPDALPAATFLARDAGRMVGLCALYLNLGVPGVLTQGFTAVAATHRGRGIARAMKRRTVDFARANGFREIRTWNNDRNVPMLRINDAMGFIRQPAWVTLVKDLPGHDPEPPGGAAP